METLLLETFMVFWAVTITILLMLVAYDLYFPPDCDCDD